MTENCKHEDCRSIHHEESGAHVTVCAQCITVRHVCFLPLDDSLEKALEKFREWGVFFSKSGRSPSFTAAIQNEMEDALARVRTGLLQSRIEKSAVIEAVASFLEAVGEKTASEKVLALKLEPVIGAKPIEPGGQI